eukprot:CAMPEP_0197873602 /NCGR_PEP_ID=MMETSP1439-20131203/3374_1 /TAXON_ID=66791 /ORGANISM="Gonyaulax spinifera, Strain CCMP409" /LENGTH=37 /DNA_ID= /DNA_START= /DNA_END= /DNA_ORIENTATION=
MSSPPGTRRPGSLDQGVGEEEHQRDHEAVDRQGLHEG